MGFPGRLWSPRCCSALLLCILVASLPLGAGCPEPCESGYQECTTQPGLRYVACTREQHLFNDGTMYTESKAAFLHCFCPLKDAACVDGRTATFCTDGYTTRDGYSGNMADTATFDDDSEPLTFAEGYATCFGYDSCQYEDYPCTHGRWFVACALGGAEVFVAFDGQSFDDRDEVKAYCSEEAIEVPCE